MNNEAYLNRTIFKQTKERAIIFVRKADVNFR